MIELERPADLAQYVGKELAERKQELMAEMQA